MKIGITGGTGFIGGALARDLASRGHKTVLISRRPHRREETDCIGPKARCLAIGLDDQESLARAFEGCEAVAHCAGINRERGDQTYRRVHVDGTRNVVQAAQRAGVKRIVLTSFLRARPTCGSGYHESKWAAEEIVRASGLDYTVLKAGVIYGKGDHMLDHLSHALHTFPVFATVGMQDYPVRPVAVQDVVSILRAVVVDGRLSRQTVSVLGPEEMTLREAVKRVARVVDKRPWMFRLPVWFHYGLGWLVERIMTVPLVSVAQVRILSEGIVEAVPTCAALPSELLPGTGFTNEQIRQGLPEAKAFGLRDLRCLAEAARCL